MEYEFKLFAGLTAKQFIFAAIGGTATFVFLQLSLKGLIPPLFGWPLTFISGASALGFTLFSYEKRPLDQWIQDFMRVMRTPLLRVWKKTDDAVKYVENKQYKPETMPEYLAIYFQTSKTVGTFKKKLEKHLDQQRQHQRINIDPSNYTQYSIYNVKLPDVPNTIAFRLIDENTPIKGVIAYMKDINNKVVRALKSTESGIIYFNKSLNNGTYRIRFEHEQYKFPELTVTFNNNTYPLFNIVPLKNE